MSKRILIVDDAAFMRMLLKDILCRAGYEICGEAADGARAVIAFEDLRPDLTLLDLTMPVMDGLEALPCIRAVDPAAKVIICAAMGQHDKITKAMDGGACDFMVKPYQPDRVLECVKKYLD